MYRNSQPGKVGESSTQYSSNLIETLMAQRQASKCSAATLGTKFGKSFPQPQTEMLGLQRPTSLVNSTDTRWGSTIGGSFKERSNNWLGFHKFPSAMLKAKALGLTIRDSPAHKFEVHRVSSSRAVIVRETLKDCDLSLHRCSSSMYAVGMQGKGNARAITPFSSLVVPEQASSGYSGDTRLVKAGEPSKSPSTGVLGPRQEGLSMYSSSSCREPLSKRTSRDSSELFSVIQGDPPSVYSASVYSMNTGVCLTLRQETSNQTNQNNMSGSLALHRCPSSMPSIGTRLRGQERPLLMQSTDTVRGRERPLSMYSLRTLLQPHSVQQTVLQLRQELTSSTLHRPISPLSSRLDNCPVRVEQHDEESSTSATDAVSATQEHSLVRKLVSMGLTKASRVKNRATWDDAYHALG
jgi:hypothetical protein